MLEPAPLARFQLAEGSCVNMTKARSQSAAPNQDDTVTLEEYFAAAALTGLLASQHGEPNIDWCCDWCFKMAAKMAEEARRRRRSLSRRKGGA